MKLIYECTCDRKPCDKEIPKINEAGEVIPPARLKSNILNTTNAWDACRICERERTISGVCYESLKIVS